MADQPTTGGSGVRSASDRIRETAKWLTISLGTLGALLLAGTSLSSIGKLAPGSDRLTVALAGGLLAALGTTMVLVGSVRTSATGIVTLPGLASDRPPSGTSAVRTDPYMLGEHANVQALAADYLAKTLARTAAIEAVGNAITEEERNRLTAAADTAQIDAMEVSEQVARMLELTSFAHLAHRWKVALWLFVIGGVVAGSGVIVFVWAANPPPGAEATAITPALVSTATPATLRLNPTGQLALGPDAECDVIRPLDVLKVGEAGSGTDVVFVEDGCVNLRLIVTPEWGTVSPE